MKISIVNYEVGNIFNIKRAFSSLGFEVDLVSDPAAVLKADKLVLPGVGAFETGIQNLKKFHLDEAVLEFKKSGKDLLGICLGMQLLMKSSEEGGNWNGLGIFEEKVQKFPTNAGVKIPHMCWNKVKLEMKNDAVQGIEDGSFFYFVHSYYVPVSKHTLMSCHYAQTDFSAGMMKDNVLAYQFHPERSSQSGLKLLENFLKR